MSPRLLLLLTAVSADRTLCPGRDANDAQLAASRVARHGADPLLDAWHAAARDARAAWNGWRTSAGRERGDAFANYRASLDREERAAALLAASVRTR